MSTINHEDISSKKKQPTENEQNYVKEITKTNNETYFIIMWCFMFLSIFTGFTSSIIAVIMAYIKRGNLNNTELENDQIRYAIRTFWYSFAWIILIAPVGIIWLIYRSIKGLLYLSDRNFLY
tara:strand:- start:10038 stop:10403 length:366 start_codon:yes stop_codon:yes gene_type:complete